MIVQNGNFRTCKPAACEENNWNGFDNGYRETLPIGKYLAFCVSYTPDNGRTWKKQWRLTDDFSTEISNTTYGQNYTRICKIKIVYWSGNSFVSKKQYNKTINS